MNYSAIDIHSHLQDKAYDADRQGVVARMEEQNVSTIIVGTDRKMSEDAVTLAEKHDFWATVGFHPTDNIEEGFEYEFYKRLAENPRVVAIGECGLDYFRLEDSRSKIHDLGKEKKRQKELFEQQIKLAMEVGKPLMIHGRPSVGSQDAYTGIFELFSTTNYLPLTTYFPGNIHFFAGSWDMAQKFLKLGFTLSFTGVITFTHDYDEVIKNTPLDMIMAETDAPYVAPVPYRGKRNESAYVLEVIKRIAKIKGESFEKIAEATTANAKRVFNLM